MIINSCSFRRKVIKEPILTKGIDYAFDNMKKNELLYNTLSLRFNANVRYDKKEHKISGQIRIKKDSIIWMSLSPIIGIELARVLITPDSVKFINRMSNEYFVNNFDALNNMFKTAIDYNMLEAFLLGNDFRYYENDKFRISINNMQYLLSTVGRHKLKKYSKQENTKVLLQDIWVSPDIYKITKMSLNDVEANKKLEAIYSDFAKTEDKQLFSQKVKIEISAEKKTTIEIKYNKVIIDDTTITFPFNIPANYRKIN